MPKPIFEQRGADRQILNASLFDALAHRGTIMTQLAPDTQEMLERLRSALAETLERKRRFGQYAVIWQDGKPALVGDDAPDELADAPSYRQDSD
ncbi:hypothetical protein ACPF7Z_13685 [Halomonas sp. GXIMD04776]|uniref:hypothetical protein n=1 Tax=Halomonas sp. GXIMD04776 TaxID=3415605 RepID=UPI003CBE70C2